MNNQVFAGKVFTVRQNIFNFLGATIKVFDDKGDQILYCKQKAFKLKEDVRIYKDETKTEEIFRIAARNIIDFSATYDIIDSQTNSKVGALRRKGLKSMFKDEWEILDVNDVVVGLIKEDSAMLAALRRIFTNLIPQKFHVYHGNEQIAVFARAFNPFVNKMMIDFSADKNNVLDHRIGIASSLLLTIIENKG
jgi:hypothetical protein